MAWALSIWGWDLSSMYVLMLGTISLSPAFPIVLKLSILSSNTVDFIKICSSYEKYCFVYGLYFFIFKVYQTASNKTDEGSTFTISCFNFVWMLFSCFFLSSNSLFFDFNSLLLCALDSREISVFTISSRWEISRDLFQSSSLSRPVSAPKHK